MTYDPLEPLPRLRYVETFPLEAEGHTLVAVKDPQRYATAMLTVERSTLYVLSFCDGRRTWGDLATDYAQQSGGRELPMDAVRNMLGVFDEHFYFDTPRFQAHREAVDSAWYAAKVRPSMLFDYAGPGSEESAREDLRRMLGDFFRAEGLPPGPAPAPERSDAAVLIAPHIDYQRGGRVWAAAYGEFVRSFQGRTVVILGTNHQAHRLPVSLTRKDFATPFGVMHTDPVLVETIASAMPFDAFDDELPHRVEHSVELAAVMLAYLRPDVTIVPVLVGSARHLVSGDEDPDTDEAFLALAETCRAILEEGGDEVGLIASVDLAHVGPMFDDDFRIDGAKAQINRERDLAMLDPLTRGDTAGFVSFVAEEKDVRRICGLAPIYVAATACDLPFEMIRHDQWVHPQGEGLVSYAGMIARR